MLLTQTRSVCVMVDTGRQENPSSCGLPTAFLGKRRAGILTQSRIQARRISKDFNCRTLSKGKRFYQQTMSALYFQLNWKEYANIRVPFLIIINTE